MELFPCGSAVLSECGRYRYRLTRDLGAGAPVCFIMLNPSTADADTDDQTIRKCKMFATRWGFGQIIVVNLFAWRATDPRELRKVPDPIGPGNDEHIRWAVAEAAMTVAAWGVEQPALVAARAFHVGRQLLGHSRLHCIATTKRNEPKHPLYLPASSQPRLWPMDMR